MDRGKLYALKQRDRTMRTAILSLCGLLVLALCAGQRGMARPLAPNDTSLVGAPGALTRFALPVYESRLQYVNRVWLALTTWGVLGTEGRNRVAYKDRDVLGIDYSPSFEFPAGTRNDYLYGGSLWIGGIVGTDTLVSIGMNGVSAPRDEWSGYDTISESSSDIASPYYNPGAHADQEFFVRVYDTLVLNSVDEVDGRPHIPLNLEVSQTSFAWSDPALRDFVIIQYWIRNIGSHPIAKMTAGLYIDADVFNQNSPPSNPFNDDVSGFVHSYPHPLAPSLEEPLNIAWSEDHDGDPISGAYTPFCPNGAAGLRILDAPPVNNISFNWWLIGGTAAQDWGPVREGARPTQPGSSLGSPLGDRYCYYVMTNGEIDYDQRTANLDHTSDGWRPPLRAGGCDIADGLDARLLLSAGPTCDPLYPGDSIPFVLAVCGGSGVHTDPLAIFRCFDPYPFMATLDYSGLARAARWAAWLYDAPGIDTDGDGYRGEYIVADGDTVFYTGDMGAPPHAGGSCGPAASGSPDFIRPSAPPCPQISARALSGAVVVRWNGSVSETSRDLYLQRRDFQGYRLYVSPTGAAGSYSLVDSWEEWDGLSGGSAGMIQRIGTDSTVAGNGELLHYGIYEARLDGLSSGSLTYVSVTCFDSGDAEVGLDPIESPVGSCAVTVLPLVSDTSKSLIDIAPRQCPNWLAPVSPVPLGRVVPVQAEPGPTTKLTVAILGQDALDVHDIDPASILLEGCTPTDFSYADVSSPLVRNSPCDCWEGAPDGWMDLVVTFDETAVLGDLGPVVSGEQVELTLTAEIFGGTPFSGHDCMTIGSSALTPLAADANLQGAEFLRSFPNPFNAAATVSYALKETGPVRIEIFDILGRKVTTLVDAVEAEGPHSANWNGTDRSGRSVSSGTYLCRLSTNRGERSVKLILLK